MKNYDGGEHEYVITSAANAMFSGPETYIFPADEAGDVADFSELDGSYKGDLDHQRAIINAGYEVVVCIDDTIIEDDEPKLLGDGG